MVFAFLIYGPEKSRTYCNPPVPTYPASSRATTPTQHLPPSHPLAIVCRDKVACEQEKQLQKMSAFYNCELHFPWNVNRSYLAKCARKTMQTTTATSIRTKKDPDTDTGAMRRAKGQKGWGTARAALPRFEVNVQIMYNAARQHLLRLNALPGGTGPRWAEGGAWA